MMTTRIAHAVATPHSTLAARFGALLSQAMAIPRLWARRRHDRRALRQLDDHLLRDIGVDRVEVEAIAARPFWRA
jgi:uncharacterized protein YjiS (DUF1127 family)